jgi:serine/threonine protein kinase/Flp pilus assembly protein TadD
MNEELSEFDPVDEAAEEFVERYRRGERPPLSEYTNRYPAVADKIRALFPALVAMEEVGPVDVTPTARRQARQEAIPPQLGDYQIVREIARGGMGIVYEAIQQSLSRRVALKVLPLQGKTCANDLNRFQSEARAAARLHHTNIVPVFDVGEHNGIYYFAMQFIQGQTLDSVLEEVKRLRKKGKPTTGPVPRLATEVAGGLLSGRFRQRGSVTEEAPVEQTGRADLANEGEKTECRSPSGEPSAPPPQSGPPPASSAAPSSGSTSSIVSLPPGSYYQSVAHVGLQVAEALDYAHQQRILHRDIKPSNLMLDTKGTVWVMDFGLAKAEGSGDLTRAGDIVGTLRYMPPERFQGHADARSDIYSLGLTLYEMVTLRPAFGFSEKAHLVEGILRQEPSSLRKLEPRIPRDLETIILKASAKEPGRRYQSTAEMAEDLRRFLADRPIQARRTRVLERAWRWCRRNPAWASMWAVVAMLLVGTGWAMRDRAVREAAVDREVSRILHEADTLVQSAKWPEAVAAVERAQKLLTAAGRREMPVRLTELQSDLAFAQRLEDVYRQPKTEDFLWGHEPDTAYAEAFAGAGIDLANLSAAEAVERIQSRSIRRELVRALDLWSLMRYHSEITGGATKSRPDWKQLTQIAAAVDADPLRNQLRQARQRGDRKALEAVAAIADVGQLPPESLLQLTTALYQSGARDTAMAIARRALLVHPGDFWLNSFLGWWCLSAQPPQYDDAVRYYTASWGIRPRNHVSVNMIGEALAGKKALAEAVAAFSRAIELKPEYREARLGRGELYVASGLWDLAAADFEEMFKVHPPARPVPCLSRALLRLYVGDRASYRELCVYMPKHFNTENTRPGQLNDLVRACTLAAAPEADLGWAMRLAQKAVKEGPHPWNYTAFGLAHYRAGNYEAAIENLQQSLTVDRNWLRGGHNHPVLALAYHRLGRAKEARQALDQSARLLDEWSNEFLRRPIGDLLRTRGAAHVEGRPMLWWDWMSCWLLYREAKTVIDGAPPAEDPRLHVVRARALAALGDHDGAAAACDKALELAGPKNALVHNNLAWLLATCPDVKSRDPVQAVALAKRAVELAPNSGNYWNTLGTALYRTGDPKGAIAALKRSDEAAQGQPTEL